MLRYLKGTSKMSLEYKRENGPVLSGFVDADWANDSQDRKSTTGFVLYVYGNPVVWSSRKQPIVTLSTCEAEYVAAASAACEAVWIMKILKDLQVDVPLPVALKEDNSGCIQVANNPETKRSKHIDVKFHFIRELIFNGKLELQKISSEDQIADIFTKALGRLLFQKHRDSLSLKLLNWGIVKDIEHQLYRK
jgi:hypothetical protein